MLCRLTNLKGTIGPWVRMATKNTFTTCFDSEVPLLLCSPSVHWNPIDKNHSSLECAKTTLYKYVHRNWDMTMTSLKKAVHCSTKTQPHPMWLVSGSTRPSQAVACRSPLPQRRPARAGHFRPSHSRPPSGVVMTKPHPSRDLPSAPDASCQLFEMGQWIKMAIY